MTTDYSAYTDTQLKDAQHHIKALEHLDIAPSIKPDLHEVFIFIDAEKDRRLARKYVVGSLTQEFRGLALDTASKFGGITSSIDATLAAVFSKLHDEGRVTTASGQGLLWETLDQIPEGVWFERVNGNHHHFIKVKHGRELRPGTPGFYSAGKDRTGPILAETPGDGPYRPAWITAE